MLGRGMIGQVVGDYRITEVLGEGGMGIVFKGVHERLGQVVAIKMLHPTLITEERIKSRFVREAQALARLNHPYIVRLFQFVNRDDDCFIVMEFMDGRTIDQLMDEIGIVPEAKAAEYYVQVLAAMHYAHSLGIIHRDIKPSNIAVTPSGTVKVLDFGTAKVVGESKLTQEGMTLGTLIYMSPEQICGKELDHRSDIYSLGVTLYEMVTKHLPHYCEDEMTLVREIARGVPDPPSKHYPYLTAEFERIILRAIEKDPSRRYQTADEFLKDINAFLGQQKIKEAKQTPPSGVHPIQLPKDRPGASASAVAAGGGGLNVGLLVGAIAALLALAGSGTAVLVSGGDPALGGTLLGLGVVASIVLGLLAFRGASGDDEVPGGVPEEGLGEQTITTDGSGPSAFRPPSDDERAGAVPLDHAPPQQQPQVAAYLYVVNGPDQGRSWALPFGAATVGRGEHNTIMLNDRGVSGTHAQFSFDGTQFTVTDLQSRNGVFVNNQRITTTPVNDRDVVVLGNTHLAFSLQQVPPG